MSSREHPQPLAGYKPAQYEQEECELARPTSSKTVCRPLVLRMAGFPFSWLADAADPSLAALSAEHAAAVDALERLRRQTEDPDLLARLHTKDDGRAVRAARSGRYPALADAADPAGTELSAEVRTLVDALSAADVRERRLGAEFDLTYKRAIQESRRSVVQRFQDDAELRNALLVLNPGSFATWNRWLDGLDRDPDGWSKKDREKADPLALYLQRCCAKNDTTGYSGPFAIGCFDGDVAGVEACAVPLDSQAFLARWAAQAVLDRLLRNPRSVGLARPRRAPGTTLTVDGAEDLPFDYRRRTGRLDSVIGRLVRHTDLTPLQRRIVEACDGERTVADLQALLDPSADEVTRHDIEDALCHLRDWGLLILGPEFPYGTDSVLPLLDEVAAHCQDRPVQRLLSTVKRTLADLPYKDLGERAGLLGTVAAELLAVTGERDEHEYRQFYGDRAPVFEDSEGCVGGLRLGRETTEYVERHIDLITDSYLLLPRNRLVLERQLLADWFARRFATRSVGLTTYLAAFAEDEARLSGLYTELEASLAVLHEKLLAAATDDMSGNSPAAFAGSSLAAVVAQYDVDVPAVCNVDLMFAAAPHAAGVPVPASAVVSEVHADEEGLNHSIFGPRIARDFPDFAAEVVAGYTALLEPGEVVMNASLHHRQKGFIRSALPCPEIEAFDRSPLPPDLRRRMADLDVVLDRNRLHLVERATRHRVRLIALPFAWLGLPFNPMHVFGFPQRQTGRLFNPTGRHLPQIVYGQHLVLSRAAWSVDPAGITMRDARSSFRRIQQLRSQLGLPRHVFASVPEEGKPVYVDLDNPLLVRQLSKFARRTSSLTLTEMLPAPEHLWLRPDGRALTSEIRFSVFDYANARS